MNKLFCILMLAANTAMAAGADAINTKKWDIWNRAVDTLPLFDVPSGGVWFDFPVSPEPDPNATSPWAGYLIRPTSKAITGTQIVVTFRVEATEGVLWNYKSDTNNVSNTPAGFRVYVQTEYLWNPYDFTRWWSNPVHYKMADAGTDSGILTITVPIHPHQWSEVAGRFGDDPRYPQPEGVNLFYEAFRRPTYIGITFGGGMFFGHGVNVSNGTARFTLLGWEAQ